MAVISRPWGAMNISVTGQGPLVVLAGSLGTGLTLWDALVARLPQGFTYARFDMAGHGLSDVAERVSIPSLAEDAAALIETLDMGPAAVIGLSIGGQIAQALAAARPELVRALVLSNTAVKMGNAEGWQARIAAIQAGGIEVIADAVMERWFAPAFRATPELAVWRNMMTRTPVAGYIAACRALAAADLTSGTAALRLPALVLAGAEDGASPPDLVAATAALIPGAAFHILPGTGHIPCVEAPDAMAALVGPFLKATV